MKNTLYTLGLIATISFTACHGDAPQTEATTNTLSPVPVTTTTADTSKSIWNNTTTDTKQQPLPANTVTPQASTTSSAANPEHGKPGHRCDIAVGAPLNSPKTQQQPPLQPAQQSIAPTQPLPSTNNTGTVKLNPAHGQPGHDCAIPVGQPLKG